jgi:anti-anti-sigma factor
MNVESLLKNRKKESNMEINITTKEDITIVDIIGRLDGRTAPQAQQEIIPLIDSDCLLVINMKECDYVSSAGLRVILMIGKKLAAVDGEGALANLSDEVKDIMEMTGFDHVFENYDSIESAIEAVRGE